VGRDKGRGKGKRHEGVGLLQLREGNRGRREGTGGEKIRKGWGEGEGV